jgi:hypothetical protein
VLDEELSLDVVELSVVPSDTLEPDEVTVEVVAMLEDNCETRLLSVVGGKTRTQLETSIENNDAIMIFFIRTP